MRLTPLAPLLAALALVAACSGGGKDGDDDTGDDDDGGFENPGPVDVPTPTGGLQETLPDLTVDESILANGYYGEGPPDIVTRTVNPDNCGYIEGCFTGTGSRRLLRFDVAVQNHGPVDLVLGNPYDNLEDYEYPTCHGHPHYKDFAEYELRDENGIVATGRKQAFCLMDIDNFNSQDPSGNYDCDYQGISAGWADVYDRSLDCQWIDITDIAPGEYTLVVRVNAANKIPEAGPLPNSGSIQVTIP